MAKLSILHAPALALICGLTGAGQEDSADKKKPADPKAPQRIDFAAINRTIDKLPAVSADARYGLFLFGINGEKRMFAVLDRSDAKGAYDILWLDLNANGDLTEKGERLEANKAGFALPEFTDPGTGARHKQFSLSWSPDSVRFSILWRGEKVTMGGYGPEHRTYAQFASTPAEAPVYVPGWDRPFEFEHWMSGVFKRGESTDFKVFVGNRGDRTGTFSTVNDRFLPKGADPEATLICTDMNGKERRIRWTLSRRC